MLNPSNFIERDSWKGPTGPDLIKINQAAYFGLIAFMQKNLPAPKDGLCVIKGCTSLGLEIDCIDEQYSADYSTWRWLCRKHKTEKLIGGL